MKILQPPKSRCRSPRLRQNKSCICAFHALTLPKASSLNPNVKNVPPPPTMIICHLGQPFLFSFSLLALSVSQESHVTLLTLLSRSLYNLNVVQKSEYIRVVFFPFLSLSFSFFQLFPLNFCEQTLKKVTFLTFCLAHFFSTFPFACSLSLFIFYSFILSLSKSCVFLSLAHSLDLSIVKKSSHSKAWSSTISTSLACLPTLETSHLVSPPLTD